MAAHILPWRTGTRYEAKTQAAITTLQEAEGREAGLVFLDPPDLFGIGVDAEDETALDQQTSAFAAIVKEVEAALSSGGSVMIMGSPRVVTAWDTAANWAGLKYRATLVVLWDRSRNHRGPAANMSVPSVHTCIRWHVRPGLRYGRPSPVVEMRSDVVVCRELPVLERSNPAQRPVELLNFLLSISTRRGDLVVDPFCGSGSFLVAAEMNGRRWIAGDTDPVQCRIAERRTQLIEIEESQLQPMFWWTGSGKPAEIAV